MWLVLPVKEDATDEGEWEHDPERDAQDDEHDAGGQTDRRNRRAPQVAERPPDVLCQQSTPFSVVLTD